MLPPIGIFVISTLSTIELDDERSLLFCFCPGVFLSIVSPELEIHSLSIHYLYQDKSIFFDFYVNAININVPGGMTGVLVLIGELVR